MADIAPPRPRPQPRRSTVTQNPPLSFPALRSPRMPNSSPNFSNPPTTAMQAANSGTYLSTSRRSTDPYLDTLITGRKLTELERLREEYIEKYGKNWGRNWNEMADGEKDVKRWLEMKRLAPRGYQVLHEPQQSVGDTKFKDTRGYVEHSEECGGVTLNPAAGWQSPGRSFGEV